MIIYKKKKKYIGFSLTSSYAKNEPHHHSHILKKKKNNRYTLIFLYNYVSNK